MPLRQSDFEGAAMADFAYEGFAVPVRAAAASLGRVDVEDASAQDFFADFVKERKPAVISGLPEDLATLRAWSNTELRRAAGGARVKVEKRGGAAGASSFGQGVKEAMTFGAFLDRVDAGDESMYLTTQDLGSNALDQQELMAAPMVELRADKKTGGFPLRPALMGNLITSSVNMWMGNSKDGTSTGLHHDYHDNLYILLRGRKTFRLYSPADASLMYTRGEIARVHPNGRINYKGCPTRADGSDEFMERRLGLALAKRDAEQALVDAEAALARGEAGAQSRVDAAETALDAALDALLSAPSSSDNKKRTNVSLFAAPQDTDVGVDDDDDDDDDDAFDWSNLRDDYEESDGDLAADDDDDDEEEEEATKSKVKAAGTKGRSAKRQKVAESEVVEDEADPTVTPLNFSLVNDPERPDRERFPLFARATPLIVHVAAGEMLYLPCGWFHEVTSSSPPSSEKGFPGHLAVNYWFHPPSRADFADPYADKHWAIDWSARRRL